MATGSTSRMLLPEAFTGSNNLESYVTHFELLAELQKWKRTEGDPAREVDDRPHYFALSLQKSAIEFYRTLPQATRENYDQCVKANVSPQNVYKPFKSSVQHILTLLVRKKPKIGDLLQ